LLIIDDLDMSKLPLTAAKSDSCMGPPDGGQVQGNHPEARPFVGVDRDGYQGC